MHVHRLRIPLIRPFRTAGGEVSVRDLLLIESRGPDGGDRGTGWGEAAPFPGQDEPLDVVLEEATLGRITSTLAAGIDEARADMLSRATGVPLVQGGARSVPVSLAIGLDAPLEQVAAAVERGITRFKVKVAPGATSHVAALRGSHADITIGLDANRSFTDSDLGQLYGLVQYGLSYIEEPFIAWDARGAGRLRNAGVPLFADESIGRLEDVKRLAGEGIVDGVTLKPGRLGWEGSLKAVEAARHHGLLWRASGLLETSVGRAYSNLLAAQPDAFTSDVAPASWFFESDVIQADGMVDAVTIGDGVGIGIDPDPATIERYRVATYELGG